MEHLERLFKLAPEVIYSLDKKGKITYLSPAFEERTGWQVEEWVGRSFRSLIHKGDLARAVRIFLQVLAGTGIGPYELRIKKSNGDYLVGEFTTAPHVENGKISGVIGIGRDVTERNKLSVELQQSRHQLRVILENIAEGITVLDATGKLIFVNKVVAEMANYKSARHMIENPNKWQDRYEVRDEKGNVFPIELLPTQLALAGHEKPEAIINYIDKKTGDNKWSRVKARPAFDDNNNVTMVISIVGDITDSVLMEKKKDEFMSIASHELKTPLTSLIIYTQLMEKKVVEGGHRDLTKDINNISRQVDRITSLIAELFDISKIETNNLILNETYFSTKSLATEMIKDMRTSFPTHKFGIEKLDDVKVKADKERIEQVLINLFSNAVKYSPDRSVVSISVKKNKQYVKFDISDQGVGINREDQKKIFERFYRVYDEENRQQGLGMGLYICTEIIKKHGGKMSVESKQGKGSTFSFTLPLKKIQ